MWSYSELAVSLNSTLWGLILRTFSSLLTHEMSSHRELGVSFPFVCNLHRELVGSSSWDHPDELEITVQWQKWGNCEIVSYELTILAHCDLWVILYCEIFRWALFEYGVRSQLHWEVHLFVKSHPSEKFDLTKMSWWDHDILTATSHDYFTATSFWSHTSN